MKLDNGYMRVNSIPSTLYMIETFCNKKICFKELLGKMLQKSWHFDCDYTEFTDYSDMTSS